MENASKALLIAASTLIAVMILSLMVYMFKRFGNTAHTTDKKFEQRVIDAFNSKFDVYETGGTHNLSDNFDITTVRSPSTGSETKTENFKYSELFGTATFPKPELYEKALYSANQNLNTCYDVVTCVNDAININYQNNNSYTYSGLEVQNTVEVIVDLGASNKFNFSKNFQYLVIEPNKDVKDRNIYGIEKITTDKSTNTENKKVNVENFTTSNPINVYDMLKELRTTKIISVDGKSCTVYKYYFFGETFFNDITGQIETVKFKLVENEKFD